jgi:hypothetical protein
MNDLNIANLSRVRLIARGGSGRVYSALRTLHGDTVAVKVLDLPSNAAARTMLYFERELRSLEGLSQVPGVVSVLDSGTTGDGLPYMIMPLLVGGSGADRMTDDGMDWRQAVDIVAQVATTVQGAHDLGIWHRDIKPANILFTATNDPFVADFGIAKLLDSAGATTEVACTPNYASPETIEGRHEATSDVYALAATLVALVTGRAPFSDHDGGVLHTMHRVMTEPSPDLAAYGCPAALAELVTSSMDKDPATRPPSPIEFARRLQLVTSADPADAGVGTTATAPATLQVAGLTHQPEDIDTPSPAPMQPPGWAARHRAKLVGAAAVLVVLGLVIGLRSVSDDPATNEVAGVALTAGDTAELVDPSDVDDSSSQDRASSEDATGVDNGASPDDEASSDDLASPDDGASSDDGAAQEAVPAAGPPAASFRDFVVLGHGVHSAELGDHGPVAAITFTIAPDDTAGPANSPYTVQLVTEPVGGRLVDSYTCPTAFTCRGTLAGDGEQAGYWIRLSEVEDQDRTIVLQSIDYVVRCADDQTSFEVQLPGATPTGQQPCPAVVAPVESDAETEEQPRRIDVNCSANIGPWIGVNDEFTLSVTSPDDALVAEFEHGDGSGRFGVRTGRYLQPGTYTAVTYWTASDGQTGESVCAEFTVVAGWSICTSAQSPTVGQVYEVDPGIDFLAVRSAPGVSPDNEVGSLDPGARLPFTGCLRSSRGVWWQSAQGWSSKNYIGPIGSFGTSSPNPAPPTVAPPAITSSQPDLPATRPWICLEGKITPDGLKCFVYAVNGQCSRGVRAVISAELTICVLSDSTCPAGYVSAPEIRGCRLSTP